MNEVPPGMQVELRKAKRYRLSAPAVFWWRDSGGILQERMGVTRDICSTGGFVLADAHPPGGAHVEVDVYFPLSDMKIVQLHGDGKVVRLERQENVISGFAAELAFQTEPAGRALSERSDNS
jgi:hypothetical protein